MSTSDRELLSALVDHSVAPRILDIHLDDCDDNACTGCEPEHLAEQGAAKPTARDRLIAKVAFGSDRYEADFLAELDAYRTEVLAEAAVVALNLRQFEKAYGARAGAQVSENVGIVRVADELTRLAEAGESRG